MNRTTRLLAAVAVLAVFALPDLLHAQSPWRRDDFVRNAMVGAASSNGTVSGAGVTVKEYGTPPIHHTVFTLTAVSVTTADHTTSGGSGSLLIYTFPLGFTKVSGCAVHAVTGEASANITATAALVHSLGSAAEGGDASLTSTEADIVASTPGTLTSSAGVFDSYGLTAVGYDGHSTAAKLYLNVAMPDAASSGAGAISYTGTIVCDWTSLPDLY